jgi:hypothetical protein
MSWVAAVKKYAEQTGSAFGIPKRGSPAYDAIKKIQSGMSGSTGMEAPAKPAGDMSSQMGGVVVAGPGPGIVAAPGKRRRRTSARVPAAADADAVRKRKGMAAKRRGGRRGEKK